MLRKSTINRDQILALIEERMELSRIHLAVIRPAWSKTALLYGISLLIH